MRLKRPIQTRFRYGSPTRVNLATHHNSQAHSSKGTQSHHDTRKLATLRRLVGTRFQVLFHDPSPGHFSPFPHGTSPLSVTREYLGLPGGPARFTRDFSGPVLLGIPLKESTRFRLRDSHRLRSTFPDASTTQAIYHSPAQTAALTRTVPQPRTRNACRLSHAHGLASSAFAHHYSGNHCCFLFLRVLRCFTSPRYLQPPYVFRRGQQPHDACSGFPIRKSPDQSLVADSPGLIAGSHVLHRLLVPRHPPCALKNLANLQNKMLASTVQFSRYGRSRHPHTSASAAGRTGSEGMPQRPFPQDPTACSTSQSPPPPVPTPRKPGRTELRQPISRPNNQCSTSELPPQDIRRDMALDAHLRTTSRASCSLERR